MTSLEVIVALAIAVGLVGIVLPVLPGLLLVWVAILAWALETWSAVGWAVLGGATLVVAVCEVLKYVVPGRRMRAAGVPTRTLVVGGVLGIVGFFVVPVVGLFAGFVLGVWLAERVRLGAGGQAWQSTKHALRAVGLSMLFELVAGTIVAVGWGVAVATT